MKSRKDFSQLAWSNRLCHTHKEYKLRTKSWVNKEKSERVIKFNQKSSKPYIDINTELADLKKLFKIDQ